MDIKCAAAAIRKVVDQLNLETGRTVFNEWVLVEIYDDQWSVHAYQASNSEEFAEHFQDEIGRLDELIAPNEMVVGTLGFVDDVDSEKFDAYMCVGPHVFAFFNNTSETTRQMCRHPGWPSLQGRFQRAMHVFVEDPLVSPHMRFRLSMLHGDTSKDPSRRRISEERYALYTDAIQCPRKESNPDECPLHELRLLPYEQRFATIDKMSEEEVRRLYQHHQECLNRYDKENPFAVSMPFQLKNKTP
jgi:hypothetical protein